MNGSILFTNKSLLSIVREKRIELKDKVVVATVIVAPAYCLILQHNVPQFSNGYYLLQY